MSSVRGPLNLYSYLLINLSNIIQSDLKYRGWRVDYLIIYSMYTKGRDQARGSPVNQMTRKTSRQYRSSSFSQKKLLCPVCIAVVCSVWPRYYGMHIKGSCQSNDLKHLNPVKTNTVWTHMVSLMRAVDHVRSQHRDPLVRTWNLQGLGVLSVCSSFVVVQNEKSLVALRLWSTHTRLPGATHHPILQGD